MQTARPFSSSIPFTYRQTLANLRRLGRRANFISESDFLPEINPPSVLPYMPDNGILVPGKLQFLDNQIRMDESNNWSQIKQTLIQHSIGLTVWKIQEEIHDRVGQSNISYIILALHPEGTILIRIRAVET